MPLIEAIFSVAGADRTAVICAREPFSCSADAVIATFTADFRVPDEVLEAGFQYFLGRDEVVKLLEQVAKKRASRESQAEFVAHYAMFDAYPSWFNDLPDR